MFQKKLLTMCLVLILVLSFSICVSATEPISVSAELTGINWEDVSSQLSIPSDQQLILKVQNDEQSTTSLYMKVYKYLGEEKEPLLFMEGELGIGKTDFIRIQPSIEGNYYVVLNCGKTPDDHDPDSPPCKGRAELTYGPFVKQR